ncbi:hypothetical protein AB0J80_25325 [Actinoplanes sp. NPDC049548]|uniref:hypothetical protein n=1 Tax=Actinoplanes sp. NPDC049548 TaxID=3155152 RepID=UPI003437469D
MSVDEHERLLAEYEAVRRDVARRAVARDLASKRALAAQQAAHRAERAAWATLTELREAYRSGSGDLSLVARADQAEAGYEQAREIALTVSRAAEALARRALDDSQADNRRLLELGLRLRAARPAATPA